MYSVLTSLLIFAQGAADQAAEQAPADAAKPGFGDSMLLFVPLAVVFLMILVLPDRKRQKQKEELLKSIKKDDKVVTIGGIYGIVANVKPDEDEITLKIDENKDVKIRVTKSSIAQVLSSKSEPDTSSKPTT